MTEDTPRQRRGRQLPTVDELRIWRDFIETRTRSGGAGVPVAERDLAVAG